MSIKQRPDDDRVHCPSCREQALPEDNFCESCGTELRDGPVRPDEPRTEGTRLFASPFVTDRTSG